MKKTVFLSGPMRGLLRDEARKWREKAQKLLANKFHTKHAFRGREKQEAFSDYRLAVGRDKYDVIHSDILLVNDLYPNVSMIGTSMEVLLAFQQNIPIIIFGDGHPKDYFLNYHSHVRCKNLSEACKLINEMFYD